MVGQFYILTLFFRVSFDDIRFIIAEISDQVGDEITLKLSQQDWVVEGAVRAIDPEEIREPVGHHAEVTGHALSPSRFQCLIASTANVDAVHGAGHHIESGDANHGVELYFGVTDDNAVTREVTDRLFMEIDQLHIGLVECLGVVGLGRQAPCQNGIVGTELFPQ